MTKKELNKRRNDARELAAIIKTLPDDKKKEVLNIVRGFALCSESIKKEKEEV